MRDELPENSSGDIVARAGRYYRNARYVIVAMALGAGLWFGYDGWINWPRELNDYMLKSEPERAAAHKPHSQLDIRLQQELASALIPLAPILLGFFLYRSRGEYRLSGTTLYVPGHPAIPVASITELDLAKWKRKGIAHLEYKSEPSGQTRRVTLDDFVYDQIATDKIVNKLSAWISPEPEGHHQVTAEEIGTPTEQTGSHEA